MSYFSCQYSGLVQLKGPCLEMPGQTAHWHLNHQNHFSLHCLFSLNCSTNLQTRRQPFPRLRSHSHPQLPTLLCQSLVSTPSPKTDPTERPRPLPVAINYRGMPGPRKRSLRTMIFVVGLRPHQLSLTWTEDLVHEERHKEIFHS